jgi:hypothetical protein
MSSVTRFIKQIPTDSAYFTVVGQTTLLTYTPNASVPTAPGTFAFGVSGEIGSVLRDMGQFVMSAGRMFRRVQLLSMLSNSTEGVVGEPNLLTTADSDYNVYYIEMPPKATLGLADAATVPATYVARFG